MDIPSVKRNFFRLAILLILLILNFFAFEAYGHFIAEQQGLIDAATDPAKEGMTHLANDYGLGGIFILFLIGLTSLMGIIIYKLVLAFISSNAKHIENETKQTALMKDLKGMIITIMGRK